MRATLDQLLDDYLRELEVDSRNAAVPTPLMKRAAHRRRVARQSGLASAAVAALGLIALAGAHALERGQAAPGASLAPPPIPTAGVVAPSPDAADAQRPRNVLLITTAQDVRDGFDPQDVQLKSLAILHFSADVRRVEVITVHPETAVSRPGCVPAETLHGVGTVRLSQTLELSGESTGDAGAAVTCLWTAVEQASGILVSDALVLDFATLVDIVDALGGVELCVPGPFAADYASLGLEAGHQTVDGATLLALSHARAGSGLADGTAGNRLARGAEANAGLLRALLATAEVRTLSEYESVVNSVLADVYLVPSDEAGPDHLARLLYPYRGLEASAVVPVALDFEISGTGGFVEWGDTAGATFAQVQSDLPVAADPWPSCN